MKLIFNFGHKFWIEMSDKFLSGETFLWGLIDNALLKNYTEAWNSPYLDIFVDDRFICHFENIKKVSPRDIKQKINDNLLH